MILLRSRLWLSKGLLEGVGVRQCGSTCDGDDNDHDDDDDDDDDGCYFVQYGLWCWMSICWYMLFTELWSLVGVFFAGSFVLVRRTWRY